MTEKPVKGVWLIADPDRKPTTVVYYLHGGGFCMGSPYFYLEFLMVWVHLLEQQATSASNFVNPALFALDYTLVPTGTYPKQLLQVLDGYRYILDYCKVDPSRVCFAGDSAGATLAVSALLAIAGAGARSAEIEQAASGLGRPAYATLLSPWCSLAGKMNANSPSDYLDADVLKEYGLLYAGKRRITHQQLRTSPPKEEGDHWGSIASPGDITSKALWQRATPTHGWHFIFGGEETLAPGMRELASRIEDALGDTRHTEPKSDDDTLAVNIPSNKAARGRHVTVDEETGQVHAWPVVDLFLTTATDDRLKGLRRIVKVMTENMQP
ncbi:MAG: hypothetical protein M1828_000979 [Chrysothrix sp. TS-e1954]|nr:MAG: hypothetical protein M1828_000979 [Chrysothrix sp. TS-e1954]